MAYVEHQMTESPESKCDRVNALKLGVAMYLSEKGYFPFFEVQLDTNRHLRADIYAINNKFESIIVEVKSSIDDFVYDSKWQAYLPYCSRFFFAADKETIAYINGSYDLPEMGFLTLRSWKDISPYHVVELKPAERHTFGVFADPKFLLRLVKSNCLFLKGFYKGIRKIDKTLVSDKYDQTKHLSKTILLDTDDE